MKKSFFSKALAAGLALCMLMPTTALAATSYYITVTLSGPDKKGVEREISDESSKYGSKSTPLAATVVQLVNDNYGRMETVFDETGLRYIVDNGLGAFSKESGFADGYENTYAPKVTGDADLIKALRNPKATFGDLEPNVDNTIYYTSEEELSKGNEYAVTITLNEYTTSGGGGGGGSSTKDPEPEQKPEVTPEETPDEQAKPIPPEKEINPYWPGGRANYEEGMVLGAVDFNITGVARYLNTDDHIVYMVGDDKGNFRPEDPITRAEVAQVFYNLLLNKNIEITTTFDDVPADAWYAKAVNALASLGVLNGVGDNKFEPNRSITRAEYATIAAKFAYTAYSDVRFDDVPETHWAYESISSAAAYRWIAGVGDNMFMPDRAIKRVEAATMINNVLCRAADEEKADAGLCRQFPDVPKDYWGYYNIAEATTGHDYILDEDMMNETWTLIK